MAPRMAREPISKVDTAWLRMEQPSNLMMINGVIQFDDAVDYSLLLETVRERLLVFSRFRQIAVDGPRGAWWREDPDFDLRRHVRRVALPGAADRAELEALVSDLASTPLDHARPLWQFHLVENYTAGPALIVRIHHCIADGIALVQVFLSLADSSDGALANGADRSPTPRGRRSKPGYLAQAPVFQRLLEPARDSIDFARAVGERMLDEGRKLLQEPSRATHLALEAGELAGELAHALALPNDPRTRFKGRLGVNKRVAWTEPLPLGEIKAVSRAFGCTVNDVLISAASGALRSYLLERDGEENPPQDVRATVPVNLRPLEHALELGNHFGLVFLTLPLSVANPLDRLYAINAQMNHLKSSRQAAMTFGVLAALGMGPAVLQKPILDLLSEKASAVLTNVPGPRQPMCLAGATMREMMFWVPQNGSIGLGISILSYDNQVFFGLMTDRNLVPDPASIISRFRHEFEKLLFLGMMLPLEGRPSSLSAEGLLERAIRDLDAS